MQGVLEIPDELLPVQERILAGLARVEAMFEDELASDLPPVSQMCAHVERYRGKMLRPTLVMLCGLAAGAEEITDGHVAVATVCEMVHMATLVHDDVLDEADVRRRGQTLNTLRGNEAAVILGDYLIASAYHLCSTRAGMGAARVVGLTSQVLCAGELLQLHHRHDWSLDEATYIEILDRKTAALIGAACELGASTSTSDAGVVGALRAFGRGLGIAFQIQDDLLDLTGEEAVVGKSVGKDLEKGKLTLPLIHHLREVSPEERGASLELIERAVREPRGDAATTLAGRLVSTGSVEHARDEAGRIAEEAVSGLDALPESPARAMLAYMGRAVVERSM